MFGIAAKNTATRLSFSISLLPFCWIKRAPLAARSNICQSRAKAKDP